MQAYSDAQTDGVHIRKWAQFLKFAGANPLPLILDPPLLTATIFSLESIINLTYSDAATNSLGGFWEEPPCFSFYIV